MKPLVVNFSNLAKAAQEHHGWTREELASYLKVHVDEIILWEQGMVTIPREKVFQIGFGMGFDCGLDHAELSWVEWLMEKKMNLFNRLAELCGLGRGE